MENQKELFELILELLKQNDRLFNEVKTTLELKGFETGNLDHKISRYESYLDLFEKKVLGNDYGKPSDMRVL